MTPFSTSPPTVEEIIMDTKLHWAETAMLEEPAWQTNLRQERAELEYALIRLTKFMNRSDYKEVASQKQRELLYQQHQAMTTLYNILGARICNMEV